MKQVNIKNLKELESDSDSVSDTSAPPPAPREVEESSGGTSSNTTAIPAKEKRKIKGFKRFFTRTKKDVQSTTVNNLQTKIVFGGRFSEKVDDTTVKTTTSSSQNSSKYTEEVEDQESRTVISAAGGNFYCNAEDTAYVLKSLAKRDCKGLSDFKNTEDNSLYSYDESIFSGESSFFTEDGDIFMRMDDARLLCMAPETPVGNNAWSKAFKDLMLQ